MTETSIVNRRFTPRGVFANEQRFPGKWILVACFILLMFSSGVGFYGLSVYLQAFSVEKEWSVSSISLATTFFFFVGGVSGLSIAKFIARYDVRIMILGGAVLGSGALFCMGFVNERWQLFAVYAVYALGWSASGVGPVTTVVTRWFQVGRASALAIASTGLSMGGIIVTPIIKTILDTQGVRDGSQWLALIWFLGTVPITLLLLRPFPHAYGWLPDGARVLPGETAKVIGTPMNVAIRTKFFMAISVGFIFTLGAQVGGVQQLVKLVEERTDRQTAILGTIVLSVFSIIARFAASRVLKRIDMTRFTIMIAVMQGISLAFIALMNTPIGLLIGIALFGSTIGNMLMMQSLLVAQRFGVRDYPRIAARVGLISFSGTAVGPLVLGALHDFAGGYRTSYVVAGACSFIGVAILSSAGSANAPIGEEQ